MCNVVVCRYASLALMQSFLEQKHQHAMSQLEQDMSAELEREKDELNSQMERELQKELQVSGLCVCLLVV